MPFRFLDLPAEIRHQIYELVLVSPRCVSDLYRGWRFSDTQLAPQLLRVNKTVLQETAPLLYGSNRFDLYGDFPPKFFNGIGPENAAYIRHIRVWSYSLLRTRYGPQQETAEFFETPAFSAIKSRCTSLKSLTLVMSDTAFPPKDGHAPGRTAPSLEVINEHLEQILSRPKIIVEATAWALSDEVRSEIEDRGWTAHIYGSSKIWGKNPGYSDSACTKGAAPEDDWW